MSEQIATKTERATVSLALQLDSGRRSGNGNRPTNEEIAALRDGRLTDSRRREVISFLANDPQIYHQWLNLVEATHTEADQVTATADLSTSIGGDSGATLSDQDEVERDINIVNRVGRWIRNNVVTTTLSGTGFAAAAALVLMVNINNQQVTDVDGLYTQYGQHWQTMPDMPLPTRSLGNLFAPAKSKQRQALETGIAFGLDMLGTQFIIEGVETEKLARVSQQESGLDRTEYSAFYDAGRLAALSHFRCQLNDSSQFYVTAQVATDSVVASLTQVASQEAKTLVQTYQSGQSERDAVCSFASGAIGLLKAK